jgi:hypothetical protein
MISGNIKPDEFATCKKELIEKNLHEEQMVSKMIAFIE